MSSRALRKALKNEEVNSTVTAISDEENDILERRNISRNSQKNAFGMVRTFINCGL